MPDFGFVGPAYTAPSIYQDAQELINWYLEADPNIADGARGKYTLYPTPGLVLKCQLAVGEVRGMRAFPDQTQFLAICGNTLYRIDSSFTATSVATISSSSGAINITDNGLDAYFCDGANRYTYNFASGVFAFVPATDGAFQGGIRADVTDNFIIYARPNSQQWAATDVLSTTTSALSFASADATPDNLVAAVVNNRQVFLLKQYNSECWIDVGSFPFPFQRIPGSSAQHGCASAASISLLGDSFAFVSQDRRGQGLVLMANGYTFTQISTHAVTEDLRGQVISDAVAYTYQIEGHEFYVVSFPTADKTWVYDLSTQLWNKWLSVDSFNVYHRHRSNCMVLFNDMTLVGDYANGKIYALDNAVYTEDGSTIRRLRRCPHLVADFKQQFFDRLQIQFQPGVGLATGQGSDPQAMLRWSNDGGSTWSNEHWRTIGKTGKYRNRVIWRRLGTARDRVFEVAVSDPVKAVIVSADLEYSAGDN